MSVSDLGVCLGGHAVLDALTFEAAPGDFVAIVGPNGGGKTTLVRVLLGLVTPDRGAAHVFGRPPAAGEPGLVGYVPQAKRLDRTFPARALDLVLTALHQRWPFGASMTEKKQALRALDRVGGQPLADRPLNTLSGGELQRVYLARSLARAPRLILLDEPATGIDVAGAADLYEVLETDQEQRNTTILMVTHDWNAAYHHADDVLLLDGRQVGFGRPEEVLTDDCLREAFGHTGHAHAMLMGEAGLS
ncbi:MAG: ABC transporter ATP-binding protein [Bacteroidetes bacterium SW_9_63_38]|nr:MAG: ABC transporter ATP-binding protein [Bacteroidetes bacterium SW_9_63_38]